MHIYAAVVILNLYYCRGTWIVYVLFRSVIIEQVKVFLMPRRQYHSAVNLLIFNM